MSFDITLIISVLIAFVTLFLGIFVFSSGPKTYHNRLFFLLTLSVTAWILTVILRFSSSDPFTVLLNARLTFTFATLLALNLFLFTYNFPIRLVEKVNTSRYVTLGGLFLAFSSLSNLVVDNINIDPTDGTQIDTYGFLYYPFIGYMLYCLTTSVWNLQKKRGQLDKEGNQQINYIMLGFFASVAVALLTNVFIPLATGLAELAKIGPLSTLIFITLTSIAILKHHLFSVKVIATELFIFSLWIFILLRTLAADNYYDQVADGILLILTIVIGIFLMRGVLNEVRQREKIEKLAKELATANERLKDLDKQKSEFVSIASHQLRSPLTAIKGYSSLLLENSYGPISDKVRMAVDRIFQSSQSLVVVIENFLNISRIEQGRMKYDFAPVELSALTQQIVNQLLPNAEKKGLKIIFNSKAGGSVIVQADTDKLRQVILNFVDNAIKYTPQGSIEVTLEKDAHGIPRIVVSDTGIGMKKETIETLFQKFSRAEGASKVNAGGAGLGLFLASEIMKAHHGSVRAESDGLGKGSRFIIEFAA